MCLLADFTNFCEALDKCRMLSLWGIEAIYISNDYEFSFDITGGDTHFYIRHNDVWLNITLDKYERIGNMMIYLQECMNDDIVEYEVGRIMENTHYIINKVEQTFTLSQLTDIITKCCVDASILTTAWKSATNDAI